MVWVGFQTMNKTMNRTMIHKPWAKPLTVIQGLTLSTIRSSHFCDCQIEKAGGVRWCSEALRTLGRIEWNIIANDSDFFLFFTNQIALIIKWLHHSTELLQMLTRKWQLSEFPTISFWRCWLRFLFTLIHSKMRVLLCLHVFFYLILKIKFGTKLTKVEILKKPPKFSNTCYK